MTGGEGAAKWGMTEGRVCVQAFEETRDLQKEMRQEDLKLKEEKKNAKLEKVCHPSFLPSLSPFLSR